ncbi:hypothetical protein [Variovorax sp. DAIF25]|uniref:hypothetical protein n=1 Tax=Variovorax sp. DAIF25 TaxID=3080983 RepID=UPI003D6A7638
MDGTDEFDTRLQAMQRANAPKAEEDAAIVAYERLRTARAIARSLLDDPTSADVVAVFAGINAIASSQSDGGSF